MVGLILAAMLVSPAPAATAAANAGQPVPALREIGRVRAISPFCSAFERHFNEAVRPILASDERIGAIGFTLGSIESHYGARGAELLIYDDRVHLMRYVADLQKAIPQARHELDALRASASLASDAESAAQTIELTKSLEKAVDKQRQIAIDSLGVVQAMMDLSFGSNRNESHATVVLDPRAAALVDPLAHLAGIRDARGPRASTEVQTQMPGGYDAYSASTPADARDVRSYLQWQRQLDRIGDAEGAAATTATLVSDRCR